MTKPVIVKRETKGAPLTYTELDANFQNLDDATITVNGDTGSISNNLNGTMTIAGGTALTSSVSGTTLTLNLDNTAVTAGSYTNTNITVDAQGRITSASNGSSSNAFANIAIGATTIAADSSSDTLTLVAGSNITLTPNATTDTITIAASSVTDTFASDLITFGDVGYPTIQTASTAHRILNLVGGQNSSTYKASIQLDSNDGGNILIKQDSPSSNIQLSAGQNSGSYASAGVIDALSPIRIASRTTTQRDASANNAINGTVVYNSTTNTLQGYINGAWINISSPSASTLSGTTLASGITSSSLTSVGTLSSLASSGAITSTATTGHSFYPKVTSADINTAFDTGVAMDNLNVRIHSTGGSNGQLQASAVSGSFTAYVTTLGNIAGNAVAGDTSSSGITFTAGTWTSCNFRFNLGSGGDVIEAHIMDYTNSRLYRVTVMHGNNTTGGFISIERMI